jgi:hypothetical protein
MPETLISLPTAGPEPNMDQSRQALPDSLMVCLLFSYALCAMPYAILCMAIAFAEVAPAGRHLMVY